jgi:SNF2 family DNA or RNA helicase
VITKLKQLCNYDPASGESVKWDALSLLLEDSSEPDDKIIVFSQYVQTLRFISERLQAFPHDVYTGEQTQQEREEALRRFKTLEGPRALLVSLRAGGVGLNIQEASTVVLFDRWWNPAVEDQAIQRAHRFGRSRPLHVIRYLVADTIEDRIQGVLHRKQLEFERYVDNAECAEVKAFTRDELRGMLGLSVVDADNQRTYKKPPEEGTTCPPKS